MGEGKIVGLLFGYFACLMTVTACICWYLMPPSIYYPLILPISIPFGLYFLIVTTLIFRAPLPAGIALLTASICCATLTILFPLRILGVGLELLMASLFAAAGGIAAIQEERSQ